MKRIVEIVLGGLAVGTAVKALFSPQTETATVSPSTVTQPNARSRARLGAPQRPDDDWWPRFTSIALGVKERVKANNTGILAGALAYYAMLALFPAGIAAFSIYGMVLDPAQLQDQIASLAGALPTATAEFVEAQLQQIAGASMSGLGIGVAVSLAGALWAASGGTAKLVQGTNVAYGATEDRTFIKRRGLAVLLTLGAIVFLVVTVGAATALPTWLEAAGWESGGRTVVEWLRWPAILVLVIVALGVLYQVAPNRPGTHEPLVTPGAIVAGVVWLVATFGFSFYVNRFGSFNETYGTLAGLIVLLLWFYLSGFVVLVGAELNAEIARRRR